MNRLLVLFVDGVGIGPSDPDVNPFLRAHLPTVARVLGREIPTVDRPAIEGPAGCAFPIDACLGMDGTPQSGTGQVALLTGRNAPFLLGRHFGPWPPVRLRPVLEEQSFLQRAVDAGREVVFANAYPRGYPEGRSTRRIAAPSLAAHAAGLLTRDHEALVRGEAIASEIVNDGWRDVLGHRELPVISPEEAGANLSRLAGQADLTFFAHYHTDFVGHRGDMAAAVRALERVDGLLAGVLADPPSDLAVLLASDHGNLEDMRTGHTRNPALGLTLGPRGAKLPRPTRLTDIPHAVLSFLSVSTGAN